MPSSPSRGSPRRAHGSPSKSSTTNPSASQATLTPRRPAGQRNATGEAHATPIAGSRLATSLALAAQDTVTASPPGSALGRPHGKASTEGGDCESGNPHVRAIQSRVAELMRRYDESMDSGRSGAEDEDEEDSRLDVPARWRVGDLLMATHSSLAKTSTRTERSMISEFVEDVEVSSAIGEGEHNFSLVLDQAAQKAEQMKAVLNKTLQVVKQLQLSDESDEADKDAAAAGTHQKLRELKITVDALHKEKSMVLAQLHEHVKSHKEMAAMMEEQTQELRKAQIAIACKQDELKNARDDFAFRLNDLQKMNETSQQTVGMWRDKYQATLKTLGEAEQRVTELEQRVQSEGEEITKHEFILRAKNSELEKYKERVKESEAARLRAETAQREAVAAAAESAAEAAAANKRAEAAATKAKASSADAQAKLPNKERQELEAKIRQQETTIRDLQRRLAELTETRSKFEDDNNELARIVRELQTKAQELMNAKPVATPAPAPSAPPRMASLRRTTSFSLSLRTVTTKKKRSSSSSGSRRGSQIQRPPDDLSTESDDDDEDSEAERDERELNDTLQQVVSSVFPHRVSPMEDKSDEALNDCIAQYEEDPTRQGIISGEAAVIEDDATTARRLTATLTGVPRPGSRDSNSGSTVSGDTASASEIAKLQLAHVEQVARLKKQYVTGLLEYKKLIIEQYERRQNEIQQHHRMEIENLILAVQDKFKRELERRGERVLQAKESLKLLYRAMQMNGLGESGDGGRRHSSLGVFDEEDETHDGAANDESEPVPLKSILRAAVFAMSSSKGRNKQASDDISRLYDGLRSKKNSPRKPVVKVVVKQDAPPRSPEVVAAPENKGDTDWAAFLKSMRANRDATKTDAHGKGGAGGLLVHVACQVDERDFVIFDLKGLRGNYAAPENMDNYVLPSSALLGRHERIPRGDTDPSPSKRGLRGGHRAGGSLDGVLYLNEGALLSDDVVAELRGVLPFLPPGSYFLSGALRHQLLLEMLRFYAELGRRHGGKQASPNQPVADAPPPRDGRDAVEIVLGSPRDTPFLRRKAVESVERRQRLSNGALAMLRPPASSPTTGGLVSAGAMATSSLSHVRHAHGSSR